LIVDHDHAIATDQQPNVAALSFEVVDASLDLMHFDLNGREVLLPLTERGLHEQRERSCTKHRPQMAIHVVSPWFRQIASVRRS
jgi:hypothetical protein